MKTLHRNLLRPTALLLSLGGLMISTSASAQGDELNVLIVSAHPDDEAMYGGTIYRIAKELSGNVDLALLSDGSGGFRYAQLAEPLYGLELTDEAVARQYLPAIRKRELMDGGEIIGIRNYFFFDQLDHEFTTNADTVLRYVWNADAVRARLQEIMTRVRYQFVFVHLGSPGVHGHHQAASILALQAAEEMDPGRRPVVLAGMVGSKADTTQQDLSTSPAYPIAAIDEDSPTFLFDRDQPLDDTGRLTYQIVENWLIAAHRSQGAMQLLINQYELERFWLFEANPADALGAAEALFARLTPGN
jgi:LmbE family N-acetylglucosaminyl deacetylase